MQSLSFLTTMLRALAAAALDATGSRPERATSSLTALTLNIGAAARLRADAILMWLAHRDDDVIVLTETSRGLGTQLLVDGLEHLGYRTHTSAGDPVRDRGVVLATRLPVREVLDHCIDVTLPWRAAGVVLDTDPPVALLGVYVPSRDRSEHKIARKRAFIDSLLDSLGGLPEDLRERLLIVGDYNVVSRTHEPRLPGFFAYEYAMHDDLERFGFVAAHELVPMPEHPHSWIGRTGNGYLYDYVHVGTRLHDRLEACAYLHQSRDLALSDHAAVAVQLRLGP